MGDQYRYVAELRNAVKDNNFKNKPKHTQAQTA